MTVRVVTHFTHFTDSKFKVVEFKLPLFRRCPFGLGETFVALKFAAPQIPYFFEMGRVQSTNVVSGPGPMVQHLYTFSCVITVIGSLQG